MVAAFLILFFVFLATDDAFQIGISKSFSGNGRVLYNQGGSYDFDMVRPVINFNLGDVIEVSSFLRDYDLGAKIQGVYAVQDATGSVLYVGASMAVPVDISRHSIKLGSETVHSIRIQTFPNPKPEAIEAYKLELIRQLSPDGNLDNSAMWEDTAMIQDVKEEIIVDDGFAEKEKISTSRERLADAVGGDENKAADGTIESPFAEGDTESFVISPSVAEVIEFTKENVDKILDEVRPYLIADGGNVEVVSVNDFERSVQLKLQGACGSCPSSTTTMKMGIERVLKENFSNLGPVTQVEPAAATGLTIEAIEKALEKVLPAIKAMGGYVEVASVNSVSDGNVTVRFKGPARLKVGIKLVLKDVSLVTSISIEDIVDESP